MAVTQYIGARYVPLFADPTEWSDERTYEPLTIVTHEGASYTSRQFVPKGASIDNTDYWALTGNYNAQVEAYRQEVDGVAALYGGVAERLPLASFDAEHTVQAEIERATGAVAGVLPLASFDAEHTVEDAIEGVYNAFSPVLPLASFDAEHTVEDAIARSAFKPSDAYTESITYIDVAYYTGSDDNDGSEGNPVKTMGRVFEIVNESNSRMVYVHLIEPGSYDIPDGWLTNTSIHILATAAGVTLNIGDLVIYNVYMHVQGFAAANPITVNITGELHGDFNYVYFYRATINLARMTINTGTVIFTGTTLNINGTSGNNVFTNCFIQLGANTINYNVTTGAILRINGGMLNVGAAQHFGGVSGRTNQLFQLENCIARDLNSAHTYDAGYSVGAVAFNCAGCVFFASSGVKSKYEEFTTGFLGGRGILDTYNGIHELTGE